MCECSTHIFVKWKRKYKEAKEKEDEEKKNNRISKSEKGEYHLEEEKK